MSSSEKEALIKSMLKSYDTVIEHYNFVIDDISSNICDPKLEAAKEPVIDFLKEMRTAWLKCREDLQRQQNR